MVAVAPDSTLVRRGYWKSRYTGHSEAKILCTSSRTMCSSSIWVAGPGCRDRTPTPSMSCLSEMKRTNPAGAASLNGPCIVDCHLYYPPSALPVMALPALLPWKLFHAIYLAICILAYPVVLYRLSLLIEKREYRWLFISLGLAFSPYHSGIETNNISALLIPLLLLLTLCFDSVWSFALIGVIACVKPPLVLVLLFYYLLKKNKKALTVSVPIIMAISAVESYSDYVP